MSGIVKGVKKAFKAVGKFVKKYWKQIVIAAAIVFTAGVAAVGGWGAFTAAAGAGTAGGVTFGGVMSAVGSTMAAGVSSIGATLGFGGGATAGAGGAAAAGSGFAGAANAGLSAASAAGAGTAAGASAFTGAAATASAAASAAKLAALGSAAGGVSAAAANASNAARGGTGGAGAGGGNTAWWNSGTGNAANAAGGQAAGTTGFMNSPWFGPVLNAGANLVGGYMQQRAAEDAAEEARPRQLWGVPLRDDGGPQLTPEDIQIAAAPPWAVDSWRRPVLMGGSQYSSVPPSVAGQPNAVMGNPALAYDRLENPNVRNILSGEFDPTALLMRGLA